MAGEFTLTVGFGFTVTVAVAVDGTPQPTSVPVTEYEVVEAGETVILAPDAPVLHE
jgi:hypothetical protein